MGILQREGFEKMAIGALGNTSPWFAGGNTNPNEATVQNSREGSMNRGQNYLNYKRTVAAAGYNIHDLIGTPGTALRRIRYYMALVTAPANNTPIVYYLSAATNRAQIFLTTGRTVQCRNVTTAVGVASSALVLGRRYRYEYMNNPAASQQQLVMYEPDETTVFYDSGLVASSNGAHVSVRVGNATSTTLEMDYEDFAESDLSTEIGPIDPTVFGFWEAA